MPAHEKAHIIVLGLTGASTYSSRLHFFVLKVKFIMEIVLCSNIVRIRCSVCLLLILGTATLSFPRFPVRSRLECSGIGVHLICTYRADMPWSSDIFAG